MLNYISDVVAAVAFGIDGESFTNPDAELRQMGDDMFKVILLQKIWRFYKIFIFVAHFHHRIEAATCFVYAFYEQIPKIRVNLNWRNLK